MMPSLSPGILGFCLFLNIKKTKQVPHSFSAFFFVCAMNLILTFISTQCPALHWLQENVQEFGGDPTSVTLMGHGTGAACATFLMTSPAVLDGKSMKPTFWTLILLFSVIINGDL
jgi:hypothetical protein